MEEEMSGYDMKKVIDSSIGFFYTASYGSLYPALLRLTKKEYVSVTEVESSKQKKVYKLLPGGKEAFLIWLAEPLSLIRSEHLLKIFFYDFLDEDTRQQNLANYQYNLEQAIHRLQAVQQIVDGELKQVENPQDHYYRVSVLSYGLEHFRTNRQWINNIKQRNDLNHDK